ncbi:Rv3235 family protein [Tessaracoccus antarcticus]|uniref:Uncharacterized protein n=1 Tax=Tessaracoccus antarcticus TaxID=2479848 RepID=A0A3M0GFZ4_9ACTN|nr:Rv3235 family protein [Tessaracoccus antarcticus]RMB60049.1 hypothetical protein EAX62_10095 [Tessaracoccus antarcticus]
MSTDLDRRPPEITSAGIHLAPMPPQALGLVFATFEALLGRRGLHPLRPWMAPGAFLSLASHVDAGTFCQSSLGRLRIQMPSRGAIEATARVSKGQRWLACTVRLDRADRWLCSELSVIGCASR